MKARQYSETLGRVENCQVATSLHFAADGGSACIGMQMYLPKEWTEDPKRCHQAGVPKTISFRSKSTITLDLLDRALEHSVRKPIVLADAGYGDSRAFRTQIRTRGLHDLLAVPFGHPESPRSDLRERNVRGPARNKVSSLTDAPRNHYVA